MGLPWQGHGYMTEAAEVVTEYWFNVLHFPVMRVAKAVVNIASRRITEKQGMRLIAVEEQDYVSGRLPTQILEITSEEWNTHKVRSAATAT